MLAVALCYANSLRVPFLFDDPLPGVALHFRTRQLVWASFALNRALSGADTWSYHVLNALVHLACGFLLLGVLRRALALARPAAPACAHANLALVVTLLWLVHPLQTASVTYLSQRAEALATLGYLGTLYGFLRALDAPAPRRWQAFALASLAVGFLSKETVATAPLLVLLAEHALVPGTLRANLRRRWRFHLALWLVACALTLLVIAPKLFAPESSSGFGRHESFGPLDYLRTQPGVVLHYLRLVFWPHPLVFDYGWQLARTPAQWLPQALALGALALGALVWLARGAPLGLALTSFFVVLLPSSSVVPIKDLAFEHRMYLPLAPLLLLAALALRHAAAQAGPRAMRLLPWVAAAALAALGLVTVRRNHEYRSAVALWSTVVERAPANARAHNNLASALLDLEPPSRVQVDEAERLLTRARELAPETSYVHRNLARVAAARGEIGAAIAALEHALALEDSAAARGDMALLLRLSGRARESEPHLRRALELEPGRTQTRLELGRLLAALGRPAEARDELVRVAERAGPAQGAALEALSAAHAALGERAAAMAALEQALALPEVQRDPAFAARLGTRLSTLRQP